MRFFANLYERALHEFRCLAAQAEAAFGPTDMANSTAARAAAAALNAADWMLSTLDIVWRMAKAQQMRWSKPAALPFLDVRTAVLNDTLVDAFRRRHPGFRPANDDCGPITAAA